jgi:hypothetical protein
VLLVTAVYTDVQAVSRQMQHSASLGEATSVIDCNPIKRSSSASVYSRIVWLVASTLIEHCLISNCNEPLNRKKAFRPTAFSSCVCCGEPHCIIMAPARGKKHASTSACSNPLQQAGVLKLTFSFLGTRGHLCATIKQRLANAVQ